MTARSLAARDLPRVAVLRENVRAILHSATDDERVSGADWYPSARRWIAARSHEHGLPHDTVAAVVAVLSPQQSWERNLALASIALDSHAIAGVSAVRALGGVALPNSVERAARALEDPTLADVRRSARTLKVHSFWRNLCGDDDAVTVDRHAVRVALAEPEWSGDAIGSDAAYRTLADAFRFAADLEQLPASTVQAITWLVVRNIRTENRASTVSTQPI